MDSLEHLDNVDLVLLINTILRAESPTTEDLRYLASLRAEQHRRDVERKRQRPE